MVKRFNVVFCQSSSNWNPLDFGNVICAFRFTKDVLCQKQSSLDLVLFTTITPVINQCGTKIRNYFNFDTSFLLNFTFGILFQRMCTWITESTDEPPLLFVRLTCQQHFLFVIDHCDIHTLKSGRIPIGSRCNHTSTIIRCSRIVVGHTTTNFGTTDKGGCFQFTRIVFATITLEETVTGTVQRHCLKWHQLFRDQLVKVLGPCKIGGIIVDVVNFHIGKLICDHSPTGTIVQRIGCGVADNTVTQEYKHTIMLLSDRVNEVNMSLM